MSRVVSPSAAAERTGASKTARPEIAVVIPTRDRETRLAFALEALAAQTLAAERFEVIVVRVADACDGPLCEVPSGLPVRFLTSTVASPAVQRNIGWRAADAPLIVFTDDDCRPPPDWLEQLHRAQEDEMTMLQGRTEPDPDEAHLYWGLARSWLITSENEWFATCNMAYPRSLLERLDGFDERFPAAWGEDTDLGLRARELGASQCYVGEALTWHAVLPRSLPAAMREASRREGSVMVVARHPEYREELCWRYFAHVRHARLLLALSGLVAARRFPVVAALAAFPYLRAAFDSRYLSPQGFARQAAHLPVRLSLDLTEIAVFARASIRERVFLI